MATLWAAPTRHRHTEQFSGILYWPILTWPRGREGWEKQKHKMAHKQQAIATTLCKELKQATAYISHKVPLLEASGHPQNSWKNCCPKSDKHLFSSNNINTQSSEKVVRIYKIILKGKMLWSFIKFSQLILFGNALRPVWRNYMWILGLIKGLKAWHLLVLQIMLSSLGDKYGPRVALAGCLLGSALSMVSIDHFWFFLIIILLLA